MAAFSMSSRRAPKLETQSELDLHQLLVPTPTTERSKPRDSASASSGPSSDAGSFIIPEPLSRSNSVYSFSRASFSTQISSLTSINLPQAESLASSINTLPSSRKAIKALNGAAEQIQIWTKKALKVLHNLDAEEDVEWAAAAGRDGLDETEKTIHKFENLVNVYVVSIEELQTRSDIAEVRHEDLSGVVEQMEIVLDGWESVRKSLKKVHQQVELAMEWEELWSTVLQEVGAELDSLSQLIFSMEEKRHTAYTSGVQPDSQQNIDLNELETFIDEPKAKGMAPNARFSLPPAFDSSPLASPMIENQTDDSQLLSLFARMQPLRASLDFLPMRTSQFQTRAGKLFPGACRELEDKKQRLEKNWSDLSKEAEDLRRELSEDRWVMVFRNAGRQAQKMCESVERSVQKVQEAINDGYARTNPATLGKRIESFEAKKMHYGPAIERVLGIIQKGLKDRLTVNGEILRLHTDLSHRMRDLTDSMENLVHLLEPVSSKHNSRLRESISSIVSGDRSFSSATMAGTPGSSPASSVDLPSHNARATPKYGMNGYSKPAPPQSRPPISSQNKRASLLPQNRRPSTPLSARSSTALPQRGVSPAPGGASVYRQGAYVPPTNSAARPAPTPLVGKPRWSSTVKLDESADAQRSASTLTPTGYRKPYTPRSISSAFALPLRSPLAREATSSPSALPTPSNRTDQHYRSFAERVASPANGNANSILDPVPYHRSRNVSAPHSGLIRSPSSMAMQSSHKATPTTTTSNVPTLHQLPLSLSPGPRATLPPRVSSLNVRSESSPATAVKYGARHAQHAQGNSSEPTLPDLDARSDPRSDVRSDVEAEEDEALDQLISEPGSSPLSRKTITRPGSVMSGARGGKRMSLLPVPVGGRSSSLGQRNA